TSRNVASQLQVAFVSPDELRLVVREELLREGQAPVNVRLPRMVNCFVPRNLDGDADARTSMSDGDASSFQVGAADGPSGHAPSSDPST
ncbi:hypothetical protein OFC23_29530, partial [Escherichia coli]|nr:hypothetical protein [Escherichia coli]